MCIGLSTAGRLEEPHGQVLNFETSLPLSLWSWSSEIDPLPNLLFCFRSHRHEAARPVGAPHKELRTFGASCQLLLCVVSSCKFMFSRLQDFGFHSGSEARASECLPHNPSRYFSI